MVNKLKAVYDKICRLEEIIAGVCLVASVLIVMAAAIGRGIGHPLAWGMDMSTFLFAWTAFLSADVAMRKDKHVNVDLLVSRCSSKVQFILNLFNHAVIAVFLVLMVRYGFSMAYMTRFRTFQGIPGFSYMWATLTVPIGCALLLLTTLLKIRSIIINYRQSAAKGTGQRLDSVKG